MNENVFQRLTSYGYQRAKLAINSGAVYAKTAGQQAHILLYIQEPEGLRGNVDQFLSVRQMVIQAFVRAGFSEPHCLMLIESWRVGELVQETGRLSPVWFVDLRAQRLMIYENSPVDFDGIRSLIEGGLNSVPNNFRGAQSRAGGSYGGAPYKEAPYQSVQRPEKKNKTLRDFINHQGACNLTIVGLNILVFLVMELLGSTEDSYFMATHGAMYTPWIINGTGLFTLFTSMFLHFGIEHIGGNMVVLFFLGDNLERAVGHVKYLIIYLGAGLFGNLISCGIEWITNDYSVSAGASGAIFGVVGALLFIVIRNHNHLEDLSTWKLGLFLLYTLYSGFTSSGVDNAAHVGGLLAGVLLAAILYRKNGLASRR